jgi:hypothetical protein
MPTVSPSHANRELPEDAGLNQSKCRRNLRP